MIKIIKPVKIIVAGDLLPSENNYALIDRKGRCRISLWKEIYQLFADTDFSIAYLH